MSAQSLSFILAFVSKRVRDFFLLYKDENMDKVEYYEIQKIDSCFIELTF